MSRAGISIVMKSQICEMFSRGVSIRKICRSLGVSRNTVRKALRDCDVQSKADPCTVDAPSSTPIEKLAKTRPWILGLSMQEVLEKRLRGRSAKVLFQEYGPDVSYANFTKALAILVRETTGKTAARPTVRLEHRPGEKTYVDYCDGIAVYDRASGKVSFTTQLFCGVLGFSSLTFAEFTRSQKLESFISSHEQMWAYFGGVTPYIVVDNLKSAVTKAHLFDPDLNPTYCDYANQRRFAVLPARPATPRDKACVEAAIGVIQRTFYQEVKEKKFYSLGELNFALRAFIDRLNTQVMKDHGVSRRDRFAEERPLLLPSALRNFAFAHVSFFSTF